MGEGIGEQETEELYRMRFMKRQRELIPETRLSVTEGAISQFFYRGLMKVAILDPLFVQHSANTSCQLSPCASFYRAMCLQSACITPIMQQRCVRPHVRYSRTVSNPTSSTNAERQLADSRFFSHERRRDYQRRVIYRWVRKIYHFD